MIKYTTILILALLIAVSLPSIATAQQLTDNDLFGSLKEPEMNEEGVYLSQKGDNHIARINTHSSGSLNENQVLVAQRGNGNRMDAMVQGRNNQLLLAQDGYNNKYNLSLTGNGNNFAVLQEGHNNEIIQTLQNVNQLNIEILQKGNNNFILQELNDKQGINLRITQEGDGLRAYINQ